jgi:hypothetical protein
MLVLLMIAGLAAVGVVGAYWTFGASIRGELNALEAAAEPPTPVTVTAEMIARLPEPAQRYFHKAGVVGTPIPRLVRLTQKGRIRSSAEADWMTFEAEETYSVNPPAFLWRAYFPTQRTPFVLGRDLYLNGRGGISMKMMALLPVANEQGDELRAAGMMRYLNEMIWFPAAFLGDNVEIIERDAQSFTVRLSDRGLVAEAIMFVDDAGEVTNFQARRFNTATRSEEVWETPITGHADYSGYHLPKSGSAVWRLPQGDLTYIELDVTSVRYEN